MEFYQNLGPETVIKEYKEFTFNHSGVDIDESEVEDYIISGRWCFNKLIIKSIKKYFKIYVPKYTSAFLNSDSDTDIGELYIGVTDNGDVHGIPFQGTIELDYIKMKLKDVLINSLRYNHSPFKQMKVELIPVNYVYNKNIKNNLYEKYLNAKKKYIEEHNKYMENLKEWNHHHAKYAQRLVALFNDPVCRKELLDYVFKHDPTNVVINILKSDYVLEKRLHEEINELKNDPNEPYYWVCRFKDEYLDEIRSNRPIPYYKSMIINNLSPIHAFMKISEMIPIWMSNNDNINLYVIKITFVKNNPDNDIKYRDNCDRFLKCCRTVIDGRPCCVPI